MFSWLFYLAIMFWYIDALYIWHRMLLEYFLIWDPIDNQNTAQAKIKMKTRRMLLINTLVSNQNYIYLIFWYYFVDSSYIMPTGFDFLIYLI